MKTYMYALAAILIMSVISYGNSWVNISVNGIVDPPDSSILSFPSETEDIALNGFVESRVGVGEAIVTYMITQGPGTISGGQILQGDGGIFEYLPGELIPGELNYTWGDFFSDYGYQTVTSIFLIEFYDSTPPFTDMEGILADDFTFHCEGLGDVLITLIDAGNDPTLQTVFDTQIIHQVPEPATLMLLGLGGMLLRKRK